MRNGGSKRFYRWGKPPKVTHGLVQETTASIWDRLSRAVNKRLEVLLCAPRTSSTRPKRDTTSGKNSSPQNLVEIRLWHKLAHLILWNLNGWAREIAEYTQGDSFPKMGKLQKTKRKCLTNLKVWFTERADLQSGLSPPPKGRPESLPSWLLN